MNEWQEFCKIASAEAADEKALETRVAKFFCDKLNRTVNRQPNIKFGHEHKRGDLVIDKGIVIEMKSQKVNIGDEELGQLLSYMRQEKIPFGMLIGRTLEFWYDCHDTVFDPYSHTSNSPKLVFYSNLEDLDSADGTQLFKIFSEPKINFSELDAFCQKNSEKYQKTTVYNIRRQKTTPRGYYSGKNPETLAAQIESWQKFINSYPNDQRLQKAQIGRNNDIYLPQEGYQYGVSSKKVEMRTTKTDAWKRLFEPCLETIKRTMDIDESRLLNAYPVIWHNICLNDLSESEKNTTLYAEFTKFIEQLESIIQKGV